MVLKYSPSLERCAAAVSTALASVTDWVDSGMRESQYAADLVVDEAALGVLRAAGFGVLSEESGLEGGDRPIVVVLDPARRFDERLSRRAVVRNPRCAPSTSKDRSLLSSSISRAGVRYSAIRSQGTWRGR